MKIFNIRIIETNKQVTLLATCQIRRIGLDEIRFTFAKKYKAFLQIDASPFAATLLLPSMKQEEDLIIEGKISEQLYNGMHEIMKVVSTWNIGLKPINIIAKEIVPDKINPQTSATFFSGGIDSFYTYLSHKKDSKNPITHFLLIKGFDINLNNNTLWKLALANVKKVATDENINVIEVETNARSIIEPILGWDYAYGGCLASIGLSLRKKLGQIYIPSCSVTNQKFPCGSHMSIDHYWSTEQLTFIHDGSNVSRLNKVIQQIAKSSTALKYLRVCYMNIKDTYNCGKCEKCVRTMTSLCLANALEKTETLPHEFDLKLISSLVIDGKHNAIFHKENLEELRKRNILPNLQESLDRCLKNVVGESDSLGKHMKHSVIYFDHMYMNNSLFKVASPLLTAMQ